MAGADVTSGKNYTSKGPGHLVEPLRAFKGQLPRSEDGSNAIHPDGGLL